MSRYTVSELQRTTGRCGSDGGSLNLEGKRSKFASEFKQRLHEQNNTIK